MKKIIVLIFVVALFSCKKEKDSIIPKKEIIEDSSKNEFSILGKWIKLEDKKIYFNIEKQDSCNYIIEFPFQIHSPINKPIKIKYNTILIEDTIFLLSENIYP